MTLPFCCTGEAFTFANAALRITSRSELENQKNKDDGNIYSSNSDT